MTLVDESVSPLLAITVVAARGSIGVSVVGEVDLATVAQLQSALTEAIDAQPGESLTIDIAGVSLLDAAGMTALIRTREYARRQHVTVTVSNPQPLVRRAIDIVGLTQFLRLAPP